MSITLTFPKMKFNFSENYDQMLNVEKVNYKTGICTPNRREVIKPHTNKIIAQTNDNYF